MRNVSEKPAAARHPAQLDKLAAIADVLDVPLWMMFMPGAPLELLQPPLVHRFQRLIEDYVRCDPEGRQHAENMAAAGAYRVAKSPPVKAAAESILAEGSPVGLKQEVAHG